MFLIHGENSIDYCKSLHEHLQESVLVLEHFEEVPSANVPSANVLITNVVNVKTLSAPTRLIEIYIGTDENMECITILTYLDSSRIKASLNNFCKKCIQDSRVLLVSPGGSACTAFLKFLEDTGITINTANSFTLGGDGLKHCRSESYLVDAYRPTHVLYQYGDLDTTVRSLFRRNLTNISYFYDFNQKFMNPLMRKNHNEIKFTSLDDYVACVLRTSKEPLGILKHWSSWKNSAYNIFFIHYEDIHKSLSIDDFLQLPLGTCSAFTIKERKSVRSAIETTEYLDILKKIDTRLNTI